MLEAASLPHRAYRGGHPRPAVAGPVALRRGRGRGAESPGEPSRPRRRPRPDRGDPGALPGGSRERPAPCRADPSRAARGQAGPAGAEPHSPSSSSFSSRRASRLSRRSCLSISSLIRRASLASSLRQHAMMDSRVILPNWFKHSPHPLKSHALTRSHTRTGRSPHRAPQGRRGDRLDAARGRGKRQGGSDPRRSQPLLSSQSCTERRGRLHRGGSGAPRPSPELPGGRRPRRPQRPPRPPPSASARRASVRASPGRCPRPGAGAQRPRLHPAGELPRPPLWRGQPLPLSYRGSALLGPDRGDGRGGGRRATAGEEEQALGAGLARLFNGSAPRAW